MQNSFDPDLINAMGATSIGSKASSAFNELNTFGGTKFGQMRDLIEIDVLTINDIPYTSQMTEKAVYNEIYKGVYKLPKENIHGIRCAWRGHPFITIKLGTKIDIDELPREFSYSRFYINDKGEQKDYKISCETRGIRPKGIIQPGPRNNPHEGQKKWVRWLKIDQGGYDMEKEMLVNWLSKYTCNLMSDIKEENIVVSDIDEDSEAEAGAGTVQLGTSSLSVQVELVKHIPEFLPIDGKKVRIYYGGMSKQC